MKHVAAIKDFIAQGKVDEAKSALEDLLSLGPHNTEALKLRAMLLHGEGRFAEEAATWQKILEVDVEDEDAITFVLNQQMEDRELFYFSEDLPGGGRRFLAYPRTIIKMSAIGLVGCSSFLILAKLGENHPLIQNEVLLLSLFALVVIGPCIGILLAALTSLKDIVVHHKALVLATRLHRHEYRWDELSEAWIGHNLGAEKPLLELVLIPKDDLRPSLHIDLSDERSYLRARQHLLSEVTRHYGELPHRDLSEVKPRGVRALRY